MDGDQGRVGQLYLEIVLAIDCIAIFMTPCYREKNRAWHWKRRLDGRITGKSAG